MNCPVCGKEMKKGTLWSNRTVFFEERQDDGIALMPGGVQVKLTPPGLHVNECIAWCCSDCKKVVADYAEIPQKWSLF